MDRGVTGRGIGRDVAGLDTLLGIDPGDPVIGLVVAVPLVKIQQGKNYRCQRR